MEHEDFLYNGGGTLPGLGEPSSGLDSDTLNKSVLTVGKSGSGELFPGLVSDTLLILVLKVGEPGPGRGNFFFPIISYLTLTKARPPTARRC